MTRSDLLALAERVEAATGPDRELDFAVAAAVGWPDSPHSHQHARRYTESLDAALTLVPEGWTWACYHNGAAECASRDSLITKSTAATPALALTAAALCAKAAQMGDDA